MVLLSCLHGAVGVVYTCVGSTLYKPECHLGKLLIKLLGNTFSFWVVGFLERFGSKCEHWVFFVPCMAATIFASK